jgi:hypothetical protein
MIGVRIREHLFADADAYHADCFQVLVRHPVERIEEPLELPARLNEFAVRRGGDAEARRDRKARSGQLAQVCTLPADLG